MKGGSDHEAENHQCFGFEHGVQRHGGYLHFGNGFSVQLFMLYEELQDFPLPGCAVQGACFKLETLCAESPHLSARLRGCAALPQQCGQHRAEDFSGRMLIVLCSPQGEFHERRR